MLVLPVIFLFFPYIVFSFYDSNSKVVKLTSTNFDSQVLESNGLWLVEFYAPWCGHCQRLAPEWEKAAKALAGIVNVGAVDMTTDQSAGSSYGINGYPTLKFFGEDKKTPLDYNGGRSASDIINYALEQIKSITNLRLKGKAKEKKATTKTTEEKPKEAPKEGDEEVVVLTDSEFDETVMNSNDLWFIEFYAPWCGHCKTLEPEWNILSKKVKGKVMIGKVDATVNTELAKRFGINGYPTLKLFPAGKKADGLVEEYSGGRDATSLLNWVLEKKESMTPLELTQLISRDVFKTYCKEGKAVCVISFLPHIYDSSKEERNGYLSTLEDVMISSKGKPITFLWSQGGDHYQLEETLSLSSGFPAVVAISFKKSVYAVMKASYSKENLISFTNSLVAGKESFRPFSEMPSIATVEKWDGEDKKPVINEEL